MISSKLDSTSGTVCGPSMSGVRFFWKYLMKIKGKAAQHYRNVNIKILNLSSPQQTYRVLKHFATKENTPEAFIRRKVDWMMF